MKEQIKSAEEFIESKNLIANGKNISLSLNYFYRLLEEYASQFQSAQEDKQAITDNWISVEDRLPDNRSKEGWSSSLDVNILYEDNVVSTGSYSYLNTREWCDYLYGKREEVKITHWQPLPSPPKNKIRGSII